MNILVSVSGSGVSMAEEKRGQLNGTPFRHENIPGNTLRKILQKYWGGENTVVVEDGEFGTGYHRVTTGCSAGGHGWSYRLYSILTWKESSEIHNRMVKQSKEGSVVERSGVEVAFQCAYEMRNE